MKPAKLAKRRRSRVAAAPPVMQIDLAGEWRAFTRLLPEGCTVPRTVRTGDDAGALVKLAPLDGEAGAYAKVTDGRVSVLDQQRVTMKLADIEREPFRPALKMVEVEYAFRDLLTSPFTPHILVPPPITRLKTVMVTGMTNGIRRRQQGF